MFLPHAVAVTGLTSAEAARRLQDYGPNRLTPPPKPGFLQKLWAQLNSSVIFILFAAAIIKGALQSWPAFGLVLLVIVVNTAIGLLQVRGECCRPCWGGLLLVM